VTLHADTLTIEASRSHRHDEVDEILKHLGRPTIHENPPTEVPLDGRRRIFLTDNAGNCKPLVEWAKIKTISPATLHQRLYERRRTGGRKWATDHELIHTPPRRFLDTLHHTT